MVFLSVKCTLEFRNSIKIHIKIRSKLTLVHKLFIKNHFRKLMLHTDIGFCKVRTFTVS